MFPRRPSGRRRRPRAFSPFARAFTLVELLVVIGIIAVLIGILMPALSAARRQSMQTKCLASMREIGNAFAMYAAANKGYWPCAVHDPGNPRYPLPVALPPGLPTRLRWQDRILPYISNYSVDKYQDISKVMSPDALRSTGLYGCPAYRLTEGDSIFAQDDPIFNGYSMSCYPMFPGYVTDPNGNVTNDDWAYIEGPNNKPFQYSTGQHNGINGRYFKASEWKKASDRLLLDEGLCYYISMTPFIRPPKSTNTPWSPQAYNWWPFPDAKGNDTTLLDKSTDNWENLCHFWIDGARHAPPGATKRESYERPLCNALFCDGHAQPVSVKQAWQAIVNPGGTDAPNW